MLITISGGRGDGTPWPVAGETLAVDDEEGAELCTARLAVPVAEAPPVEERTVTAAAAVSAAADVSGKAAAKAK
jgi:hypothetical protein